MISRAGLLAQNVAFYSSQFIQSKGIMKQLQKVKELIKILEGSSVAEIEIQDEDLSIRISKQAAPIATIPAAPQQVAMAIPQATIATEQPDSATSHVVRSPMVGTFYSAASPDAAPFVKVGDKVTKGQELCIIEAMKMMNHIEADVSGTIKTILANSGTPVEFDQPLFFIDV